MPADTIQPTGAGRWNILALSNDDPRKILMVAVILCLVCAVLVSSTAVLLKPLQERNKALSVKRQIISVAGLAYAGADTEQLFRDRIQMRIVDLDSGNYATDIDPAFDARDAARNPLTSIALPRDEDIAGISRRANHAAVYLVHEDDELKTIILPVHGYGLWSTMRGFLALASDAKTIAGITFYEHAETPGLGDEIEKPGWQAGFREKLAFDETGKVRITVIKGHVASSADTNYQADSVTSASSKAWQDNGSTNARYQVDGIAGATLTSTGVTRLLHFWLGDLGFGPYLERIRNTGVRP